MGFGLSACRHRRGCANRLDGEGWMHGGSENDTVVPPWGLHGFYCFLVAGWGGLSLEACHRLAYQTLAVAVAMPN